jgi:hypothetical protein
MTPYRQAALKPLTRIAAILAAGTLAVVAAGGTANARPADTCFTKTWSEAFSLGVPAGGDPAKTFSDLNPSFRVPIQITAAPGAGIASCPVYKISDLTRADLTLTFTTNNTGPQQLQSSSIAFNGSAPSNASTFTFNSDRSVTLTWAPDVIDLTLPMNSPELFAGLDAFTGIGATKWSVTQIALALSGNHYFVVPEPATWAMMIAGFGLAGAALRRQRLRLQAAV